MIMIKHTQFYGVIGATTIGTNDSGVNACYTLYIDKIAAYLYNTYIGVLRAIVKFGKSLSLYVKFETNMRYRSIISSPLFSPHSSDVISSRYFMRYATRTRCVRAIYAI